MATTEPPTPEEVGKDFRIPTQRREGAPVGKPDEFDDVIKRQLERGTRREAMPPTPGRGRGRGR